MHGNLQSVLVLPFPNTDKSIARFQNDYPWQSEVSNRQSNPILKLVRQHKKTVQAPRIKDGDVW